MGWYVGLVNAEQAHAFVRQWLEAWNGRNLDAVLALFAEQVTFTSPIAAQIVRGSGGVVRGKAALRDYWRQGLERTPGLRFELVGTYVGVDAITINFRNQAGAMVNEVLLFDGPLVVAGYATQLAEETAPEGS